MKQQKGIAAALRRFFSDKDGKLVFMQRPNLPLMVWAVARLVQWPLSGRIEDAAWLVGTAAIILWAALEIVYGTTVFRQVLGCVVLGLVII